MDLPISPSPLQACAYLLFDSTAYAAVPLTAGIIASLFHTAVLPSVTAFIAATTCSVAILRLHNYFECYNCDMINLESLFQRCYNLCVGHSRAIVLAAAICLIVSAFWPRLALIAVIPLGLLHGLISEIKVQRRMVAEPT